MTVAPATNWAGNVRFRAARVLRPESVGALQTIVRAGDRVRALGTGHSFSPIADTRGDLVSVAGLPPRLDIAADRTTATVSAGMRLGESRRASRPRASRCTTCRRCRTSPWPAQSPPAHTAPGSATPACPRR